MKKTRLILQALLLIITLASCNDDDPNSNSNTSNNFTPPTAADFAEKQAAVLDAITQIYTFNAQDGYVTFTSAKQAIVNFDTSCLTKNGQPVTGEFTVRFTEVYDRGTMLATNKPTMGINGNGDKSLLISGGEILFEAYQGTVKLETQCGYMVSIPTSITGTTDDDMTGFLGNIDATGQLTWTQANGDFWTGGNDANGSSDATYYNAFVSQFGWFNCDKFANFDGPMTTVTVTLPPGFNNTNCNVYIALVGEPNTLGYLGGEYPIGLQCHIIFVSSSTDGQWAFAVKSVTLTDNASYTFTEDDLQNPTIDNLIATINQLP